MEKRYLAKLKFQVVTELLRGDNLTAKMAFGWAISESANTSLALQVWKRSKQTCQQSLVCLAGSQGQSGDRVLQRALQDRGSLAVLEGPGYR